MNILRTWKHCYIKKLTCATHVLVCFDLLFTKNYNLRDWEIDMKQCNVCKLTESKYRCPTCRILFCSVACYKTHKDGLCQEIKQPEVEVGNVVSNGNSIAKEVEPGELTDDESDNEDTVSQEKLSILENSQTVKDMLANKHLREILKNIDDQENGEKELDSAMKLPLFAEFANECLKLVDNDENRFEETPT